MSRLGSLAAHVVILLSLLYEGSLQSCQGEPIMHEIHMRDATYITFAVNSDSVDSMGTNNALTAILFSYNELYRGEESKS